MKGWTLVVEPPNPRLARFLAAHVTTEYGPRFPRAGLSFQGGPALRFSSPQHAESVLQRIKQFPLPALVGADHEQLAALAGTVFHDGAGHYVKIAPAPSDPLDCYSHRLFVLKSCKPAISAASITIGSAENTSPMIFDPIPIDCERCELNDLFADAVPAAANFNGLILPPYHNDSENDYFSKAHQQLRRALQCTAIGATENDETPACLRLWSAIDRPLCRDVLIEGTVIGLDCADHNPTTLCLCAPVAPEPLARYRLQFLGADSAGPPWLAPPWREWTHIVARDFAAGLPEFGWSNPPSFAHTEGTPGDSEADWTLPTDRHHRLLTSFFQPLSEQLRIVDAPSESSLRQWIWPEDASDSRAVSRFHEHCWQCPAATGSFRRAWKRLFAGHALYAYELLGRRRSPAQMFPHTEGWPRLARSGRRWKLSYRIADPFFGSREQRRYEWALLLPLGSILFSNQYYTLDQQGELNGDCVLCESNDELL